MLGDRSHWGVLRLGGEDRRNFLHNQSTNAIAALQPGDWCETVFVTSTARALDLASVCATEEALLVQVSPSRRERLLETLDRYIFPMDRVELSDASADWATFDLIGPDSRAVLAELGAPPPEAGTRCTEVTLAGVPVRVLPSCGLDLPGCSLLVPAAAAAPLWQQLTAAGAVPGGTAVWENLRVRQGRPAPDRELTEDYNPLEAGLQRAIATDKGCYIGQETIARLLTYGGVKQRLWHLELDAAIAPGSTARLDGKPVATVTSVLPTASGAIALGYVRTKAGGAGTRLSFGDATGTLAPAPYLSYDG